MGERERGRFEGRGRAEVEERLPGCGEPAREAGWEPALEPGADVNP